MLVALIAFVLSTFSIARSILNFLLESISKFGDSYKMQQQRKFSLLVPSHVSIIYTEKSAICLEALTDLIVFFASVGIRRISVYDPWSYVEDNETCLSKNIWKERLRMEAPLCSSIKLTSRNAVISDTESCYVILMGKDSGRESIVRACRKLCSTQLSHEITCDAIREMLAESNVFECEFLLQIGNVKSFVGYPPWALRLTEMCSISRLSGHVTKEFCESLLRNYSRRDVRCGR